MIPCLLTQRQKEKQKLQYCMLLQFLKHQDHLGEGWGFLISELHWIWELDYLTHRIEPLLYQVQNTKFSNIPSDWCLLIISTKALFQYLIRHLIISFREVSKLWDLCLELSSHPEIWHAPSSNAAEAPVKYQSFVIFKTTGTNFAALKLDEISW